MYKWWTAWRSGERPCRHCGVKLSVSFERCPHCGGRLPWAPSRLAEILIVALVGLVLVLILRRDVLPVAQVLPPPKEAPARTGRAGLCWIGADKAGFEYLREIFPEASDDVLWAALQTKRIYVLGGVEVRIRHEGIQWHEVEVLSGEYAGYIGLVRANEFEWTTKQR